jgi:sugar phosphate isomerase/epimerase
MAALLIAARLSSWKTSFRQAIGSARVLGFDGVELDAAGDFMPRQLSQTGRREIAQIVRSHELKIAAVSCVMRHGLDVPERQESRIAYVKDVLAISKDLGAGVAIVPSGPIAVGEESADNWLGQAVGEVCTYADRIGATAALELGDNRPEDFAAFIRNFDSGALGVCVDPAALFGRGLEPVAAVDPLQEFIGYVRARDARRSPSSRLGTIVGLGEGDIDWMKLVGTLDQAGYRGWFGIDEPPERSKISVGFLRRVGVS